MPQTIIQEHCINCGACVVECPNEGIEKVRGTYAIASGLCTECFGFAPKPKCRAICPTDAIIDDSADVRAAEALAYRAAELHPERFPRD